MHSMIVSIWSVAVCMAPPATAQFLLSCCDTAVSRFRWVIYDTGNSAHPRLSATGDRKLSATRDNALSALSPRHCTLTFRESGVAVGPKQPTRGRYQPMQLDGLRPHGSLIAAILGGYGREDS